MNENTLSRYELIKTGKYLLTEGEIIENENIIYLSPPNDGRKYIWDFGSLKWVHDMSLEEEVEYYKNLIIQKNKEIENEKLAGFRNEKLESELNELKEIHLEKSHELALQIENRLK